MHIGMATHAYGNQVVEIVGPAFVSLDDMVNLQVKGAKSPTNATMPGTSRENLGSKICAD
jgi:hypothetical protein